MASPTVSPPGSMESAQQHVEPWQWSQHWRQVLFLHWEVSAHKLQAILPAYLQLDTYQDAGWVSLVAFRLERVRMRGWPPFRPCSNFLELNLRTYVWFNDEPGIYFLSIHAGSRLAMRLARWFTPLPYAFGRIISVQNNEIHRFRSYHRPDQPLLQAAFRLKGASSPVATDSLDWWLLERYRAFVPSRRSKLYRMRVRHPPWQIRDVDLDEIVTEIGVSWGLDLKEAPERCHYSERMDALVWPFERVLG